MPPGTVGVADDGCAPAPDFGQSTTCASNVIYSCACGLRLSPMSDCADSGICVTYGGTSACALSDAADPLCRSQDIPHGDGPLQVPDAGTHWSQYCEEGMLVECLGDLPVQKWPCGLCLSGSCHDFLDAGPVVPVAQDGGS